MARWCAVERPVALGGIEVLGLDGAFVGKEGAADRACLVLTRTTRATDANVWTADHFHL